MAEPKKVTTKQEELIWESSRSSKGDESSGIIQAELMRDLERLIAKCHAARTDLRNRGDVVSVVARMRQAAQLVVDITLLASVAGMKKDAENAEIIKMGKGLERAFKGRKAGVERGR